MSAAGWPTGNGSGNGSPPKRNQVDPSYDLYRHCCQDLEDRYPRLRQERFFELLLPLMGILDVENEARNIGGATWLLTTPDGMEPQLAIYFTYAGGIIIMRAVHDIR